MILSRRSIQRAQSAQGVPRQEFLQGNAAMDVLGRLGAMELIRRNIRRSAPGTLSVADPRGTLDGTAAWGPQQDLLMLIVCTPDSLCAPRNSVLPGTVFSHSPHSVREDGQPDCDGLSFHAKPALQLLRDARYCIPTHDMCMQTGQIVASATSDCGKCHDQ